MTTYELCKQLIKRDKLTGKMLDVYFAAGRLTEDQYKELIKGLRAD